jgi:glycine betaine transporter
MQKSSQNEAAGHFWVACWQMLTSFRFRSAHLVFLLVLAVAVIFPDITRQWVTTSTDWFQDKFGWFILIVCTAFVVCSVVIALSRYGNIRLGADDETPQFSLPSWIAMLFAAGMGSGLVFHGAAEPLVHFLHPPPALDSPSQDGLLARQAIATAYFHWGIHAWSIYAIAGLCIAYFAYRYNKPMLPSSVVGHYAHDSFKRAAKAAINQLAIIAVMFGLISSLAHGVVQVSSGILQLVPDSIAPQSLHVGVLLLLIACYLVSSATGIGRGIKWLSLFNIFLAMAMMLFVMAFGPSLFIMQSFTSAIGDYLDRFVYMSFNVRHFSDPGGWTKSWTISYFLWWVAWAPFVGIFIARISRGRTIREFLLGVILIPTLFSGLWFASLGITAIDMQLEAVADFSFVSFNPEAAIYVMLDNLPLAALSKLLIIILLFVFLVTSADSGAYVMAMLTTDEKNATPALNQRLFWGGLLGVCTIWALLIGENLSFFRSLAVVGGVPFLLVMIWKLICLFRALKDDYHPYMPEPRSEDE